MADAVNQSGHATLPVSKLGSSDQRDAQILPRSEQLGSLLVHLPGYCVIICKSCKFAVQPRGLSSHLLRHQIYREKRRQLLDQVAELKLLEPDEVMRPSSQVAAVPYLSIATGYRCKLPGCEHLCISQKRMIQHLHEHHQVFSRTDVDSHMHQVYLQTFFKGNKTRYFEVKPNVLSATKHSAKQSRKYRFSHLSPPSVDQESPFDDGGEVSEKVSIPQDQMENLLYLHQYTTCTGLSLTRGTESTTFWTHDLPLQAPFQPFLMHGFLGVAAFHQAILASNPKERGLHHAAGLRHQSAGLETFRSILDSPTQENSTALTAFARLLGVQFCAEAVLEAEARASTANGLVDSDVSKILKFQLLLKGGCDLLLRLQSLLPIGSGLVLSGQALQGLDDLETSPEVLHGWRPYLVNEVCARLGIALEPAISGGHHFRASSLSDVRHLVNLCLHASNLADTRQITVGWVEDIVPDTSRLRCIVQLLAEAVAASLGPAEISYHKSHGGCQPGPCAILLCYPHIPTATYAQLASLPSRLVARVPKPNPLEVEAFDHAMFSLVSCVSRCYAADAAWARWNGIESWPRMLSDHFFSMVEALNPWALVLVAHWCVLLNRQETSYWFLCGQSKRMLDIIFCNLDVKLQQFVRDCIFSLGGG